MGGFYSVCTSYKIADLVQLTKGYDYAVIRRLTISNFKKLIEQIREQQTQEIIYQLYLSLLQRMTPESYMSFNDFYAMTKKDDRPMSEIQAELDAADEAFKRKEAERDGTIQTVGKHPDQE